MSEPMHYVKGELRGTPSANGVFYRYRNDGYLKGILNYSSGKAVQEYIADALNSLTLEQIPTLEASVKETAKEIADVEVVNYVESEEFVERVVPVVIDNLVTTFDLHSNP